jgi:stage II sporulation protein AA (anti-sigma F factor antagonist)
MDSSGIGVIMGRYKKVHTLGGKVMAIHVNERVRKILQLSGLHKIVEIIEEER